MPPSPPVRRSAQMQGERGSASAAGSDQHAINSVCAGRVVDCEQAPNRCGKVCGSRGTVVEKAALHRQRPVYDVRAATGPGEDMGATCHVEANTVPIRTIERRVQRPAAVGKIPLLRKLSD